MSGLTPEGFVSKTLTEILGEIEDSEHTIIDPALDVSAERPIGQLNGIIAEREALLWELIAALRASTDPDLAEGSFLDAVCALTGTTRKGPTKSRVTVSLTLDATITVPAGTVFAVSGQPTIRFLTTSTVISVAGAGVYPVICEAENAGPVAALAGTLTIIPTPIPGLTSVINDADAELGRLTETDAELRLRRESELSRVGSTTVSAIRADIEAIEGVQSVRVFENLLDTTDVDGMPPHSIEVLVYDGVVPTVDNDVIAQTLWDNKAPIRTYGNTSGTAIDNEGNNQTVYFSRPTLKTVWVTAAVSTTGAPVGAATTLRDYLVTAANTSLLPGVDVLHVLLTCLLFDTRKELGYTWVDDITSLYLAFTASPTLTANLSVGPREIARLDTSRTSITV